jgi:hypothetical protein
LDGVEMVQRHADDSRCVFEKALKQLSQVWGQKRIEVFKKELKEKGIVIFKKVEQCNDLVTGGGK